jgi:ribokinase
MFDIICVGSATVDAFVGTGERLFQKAKKNLVKVPFGSKVLIDKLMFSTGGGGTNTAIGLSRLGFRVALVARIGLGTNSIRILNELKNEKVNCSLVMRKKGRTGFSVVLDAKGHDRTILAFKGSNNDVQYDLLNKNKLKTKWFYFSSMMNKSFQTLLKLSDYAKKNKIKVAFNPSSYLAIKGRKYLKKILDVCEILVLNKGEAGELLGKKQEKNINKLLKDLYKIVPRIVAITDGSKGVYCYDGKYKYFAKARDIRVVEATGAGDAFSSGFISGIIKGKSIEYAIQMGSANAESVIRYFGAKNNLMKYNEMIKFIKKCPRKIVKEII